MMAAWAGWYYEISYARAEKQSKINEYSKHSAAHLI